MGACHYITTQLDGFIRVNETSHLDLIELGDQNIVYPTGPELKVRDKYSKYFKSWRTLDLHNVPGVEIYDLSINHNESGKADIITNFGTSEHVEYEEGQYNCWLNIHNLLKKDGIMIHALPPFGYWPDHCRYYCDEDFFKSFEWIGYKIRLMEMMYNKLLYCVLQKETQTDFFTMQRFLKKLYFVNFSTNDICPNTNDPKNLLTTKNSNG